MADFPGWREIGPRNDGIDYERAGALEAAIREACREQLFTVVRVTIRSGAPSGPTIEIELQQQPGRKAT